MDAAPVIEAMRTAARALTAGDVRDQVRAIQVAQDALDAAKAERLAIIEATKAYEVDGASTLGTWIRNELRMTAQDATTLVRAEATFAVLPVVAEAAATGSIRADHVKAFTYGLKHLGPELMATYQEPLVVIAQHTDPTGLFQKVRQMRDTLFPDDLDEAYLKGMDTEDIQIARLMEGWHLTGFLNAVTGAKFKAVLDSVSAPHDAEDTRSGSERRTQGFDEVLSDILNNGRPSDKGVRPHLSVIVDVDTLTASAQRVQATMEDPHRVPAPMPVTQPATLTGYGAIGPNLLMCLACVSDFTAFLMKQGHGVRQDQILSVGRDHRAATLKQRRAIRVRQKGTCATPGCKHTHLEIHHVVFWADGGTTDLDLMIGLCVRCHHLLHRGLLTITGNATEGFTFTNRHGTPLRPRRQRSYRTAA